MLGGIACSKKLIIVEGDCDECKHYAPLIEKLAKINPNITTFMQPNVLGFNRSAIPTDTIEEKIENAEQPEKQKPTQMEQKVQEQ